MSFHAGQGLDGIWVVGGVTGINGGKRWLAGGFGWVENRAVAECRGVF